MKFPQSVDFFCFSFQIRQQSVKGSVLRNTMVSYIFIQAMNFLEDQQQHMNNPDGISEIVERLCFVGYQRSCHHLEGFLFYRETIVTLILCLAKKKMTQLITTIDNHEPFEHPVR